jgi:hypothetical protein
MKGLPYSMSRGPAAAAQVVRKVTYPVKNASVTVAAAGAGVGFGTAVIGYLPEGNVLFLGGTSYLQFSTADTDLIETWDGSYGIGTAADANGTIENAEEDLIAEATLAAATARVSPVTRGEKATLAMFNNTDESLELNLNVAVAAASITDATSAILTVNGTVELVFIVLGDD